MKLRDLVVSSAVCGVLFAGVSHALRQGEEMGMPQPKPGKEHAALKPMVGEWDAKVNMMGSTSEGTMVNGMEMGGLWLVSRYEGEMMGDAFTGLGLMTYDSAAKQYVGLWVDSMTTSLEPSRGSYDAATKAFTMVQDGVNPMTGEKVEMTQVTRIVDENKHVFEMSMGGQQMMSIEYTRKK